MKGCCELNDIVIIITSSHGKQTVVELLQVYAHDSKGGPDTPELAVLIISFDIPIIIITPSFSLYSFFFAVFIHPPLRKDSDYPCAIVAHNGISAANRAVN